MTESSPTSVALVAACMARGLEPEETDQVMAALYATMPPARASDIQRQLEAAINTVIENREPVDLVDLLFPHVKQDHNPLE